MKFPISNFQFPIKLALFLMVGLMSAIPVEAQVRTRPVVSADLKSAQPATKSATPSASVKESTPSSIVKEVTEKKEDITEPTPEVKGKLERFLMEHPPKPLTITNPIQHAIREAVKRGVPANMIVLVLLFPLVASLIAASRHIVGIRGFGIFLPAALSVVFVSTGITAGVLLFLTIITVATIARMLMRKMKLQYLPRMALLLWFVSLGVLAMLFLAPFLNLEELATISIFPVLILILTMESFIRVQIGKSMKQALRMSFETLIIALICSFIVQLDAVQRFVLIKPEIYIFAIGMADIYMGKYTGLRLLEYKKFKEILK